MVLEINIKNNKQDIEFIVENRTQDVKYVYLDTYENSKNYLSMEEMDHSFKLNASDILVEQGITKSTYSISSEQLSMKRIIGLFVLTIYYDNGNIENRIVYDLNELYCVRMNYIQNICNTCCDNKRERMLIVLMFREMLLRNSIAFNLVDDALKYYTEIFRPFCKKDHPVNKCLTGLCCSGGSCKIR